MSKGSFLKPEGKGKESGKNPVESEANEGLSHRGPYDKRSESAEDGHKKESESRDSSGSGTEKRGRKTIGSTVIGRKIASSWYEKNPGTKNRLLLGCLAPASWAYGAAGEARNRAYDRGWLPVIRADVPVVSVGNIVAGGAGKTPVVMELTQRLQSLGHRVAIISRGYGGELKKARIVSDGKNLLLGCREAGDEPCLLSKRCKGAPVLAGPDRAELVQMAVEKFGATVAVLDDGLQHRRLHRDLEIVVMDSRSPIGNGRLIPVGPMRERMVSRADLLWLTRVNEAKEDPFESGRIIEKIKKANNCTVIRSRYEVEGISDVRGRRIGDASMLEGMRVLAFSGIAHPKSFVNSLADAGANVVTTRYFPDHHPFSNREIASVGKEAESMNLSLVTTEKDAQRLQERGLKAYVLLIRSVIVDGEEELSKKLSSLPHEKNNAAESGLHETGPDT